MQIATVLPKAHFCSRINQRGNQACARTRVESLIANEIIQRERKEGIVKEETFNERKKQIKRKNERERKEKEMIVKDEC